MYLTFYLISGLPELLRNALQSSKVLTQLRTCPNCQFSNGNTEADIPHTNSEPEDEPTTSMTENTLPTISSISSEAIELHTPLNIPSTNDFSRVEMVASPSIVSVQSNSPSSALEKDLSMSLPDMSTSEAEHTFPKIITAECLSTASFCNGLSNNSNLFRSTPDTLLVSIHNVVLLYHY